MSAVPLHTLFTSPNIATFSVDPTTPVATPVTNPSVAPATITPATTSTRSFSNAISTGRSHVLTSNTSKRQRYSFTSAPNKPGTVVVTGAPGRNVLTADHGVSLASAQYPEYTNGHFFDAIKTVVPPVQIHSFSRTQGTFQVFFLSATWAQELIKTGLAMHDCRRLECHPLGVPPVRVVVSEVPPHFDNAHLRLMLSDFGSVVGPIRSLRSSYVDKDLPHLMSFRRQAMMKFPGNSPAGLPARLFVDFNDVPHTFYISTDVRCHGCRGLGHLLVDCPTRASSINGISSAAPSTSTSTLSPPTGAGAASSPSPVTTTTSSVPGGPLALVVSTAPILPVTTLSHAHHASTVVTSAPPVFSTPMSATPSGPPFSIGKRLSTTPAQSSSGSKRPLVSHVAPSLSSCSARLSQASDIDDAMDDDDVDRVASPPLTHSDLAALFDSFYKSKTPILDHVRHHVHDPMALLDYLRSLRLDKKAWAACPLAAGFTPQAVYQYERKIRKALNAEHDNGSAHI